MLITGHASSPASRYQEALGQVAYQNVALKPQVKAAIATVQDRFPGAILAACAATGSMKPTLDENYLAVLEDRPFDRLGRGDIILIRFGSGARYSAVMHRIVDSDGANCLRTRGDALPRADSIPTTNSNYLGKRVVAAIHRQTGAVRWLVEETLNHATGLLAQK